MVEKSVPRRQYMQEFKFGAARLALSVGQHKATRRLDVPIATLGNWTRRQCNLEATSADDALPATHDETCCKRNGCRDYPLAQGSGQRQARYRSPLKGNGIFRERDAVK